MLSERMRRRLETLLDEADGSVAARDWAAVAEQARAALAIDDANEDARTFLRMAEANLGTPDATFEVASPPAPAAEQPASFAAGRYQVKKFLGEGGKKRVFLAYDALLDRDVAFALIKTEGLDDTGRERVTREAQAMGRMGAHAHVVNVFDLGEEQGAPYIVTELMGGGDVEGELERAGGPLELSRSLELAKGVARGLAFAHERGVVHRDLKPGNVWLTSDGVAKIGDFGLAVAEGRSRLTQHGLMVGTFAYMPPEQALGGEATPRSDLYSLGAMLYELVTGRPPFEGDSPTAVISQHLNTAPVAPSWHSEHCPPSLEDLILALLQKDPASRPASASEVLATLDAIDPAQPSRSHSSDSANPLDRLARGVFVGRERELERLRTALDQALAGRGSVVMLVGEPGIGKTRTTQELETYARMRGAKVLWGRAHESSGAPPYWPWVQVGRGYGAALNDPAMLRHQLGNGAGSLQLLFPELRELYTDLPAPAPMDDPMAQFRLFDAYATFLRDAAERTPLLVVLDDLHWADRPTLLLLQHIASEIAGSRILMLGAYRDTDLSRTHPLSSALAELSRTDGFTRITLGGLSRDEVARYITATAGHSAASSVVDRVHDETEGNPFFLSEVVNLLADEGTLAATSVSELRIPDGVREALGRRLDALSPDANELLRTSAIVGREFTYETLSILSQNDDATLLRYVEEALAARLIEEIGEPGRYRFVHAMIQETLLDELSTTRRVRLHGEVADALERRYGDTADARAARLAYHYLEASILDRRHAAKAAHYCELAAQQAETTSAWAEAARYYERRHQLLTEGTTSDLDEAALLFALGRSERNAGATVEGWEHLASAFGLYRDRRDGKGMGEVVLEAMRRQLLVPRGAAQEMATAALELLTDEPWLEARLLVVRCMAMVGTDAEADAERANVIAEAHGFGDVIAALKERRAYVAWLNWDMEVAVEAFYGAFRAYSALGRTAEAVGALLNRSFILMLQGDLDVYEGASLELIDLLKEARLPAHESTALAGLGSVRLLRGDWEGLDELLTEWPRSGTFAFIEPAFAAVRSLVSGDKPGALEHVARLEAWVVPVSAPLQHAYSATTRIEAGDEAGAREAFKRCVASIGLMGEGTYHRVEYGVSAGIVAFLGDEATVKRWYDEILRMPTRWSGPMAGSLDRYRGLLALRLDRVDDAQQHFRTGLEWCERERCPVEAGRCHQGLAEVAERRGQHEEATRHLDAAGELFARYGAKLYLDQVIAKKQILKA